MASVLITGTSTGIGFATALALAEQAATSMQSGTWQHRHPVGPNALPLLGWRASMTDEQFVDLNAADDDIWYSRLESDFGMAVCPAK